MILIITEITIIEIIIDKINISQKSPASISQNSNKIHTSPNSHILTNQRISIKEMINMTMIKIHMIVVMMIITEAEMITTTTETTTTEITMTEITMTRITTTNKTTIRNMMMDTIGITIELKDLLTPREVVEAEAEEEEVEEATRRASTEVATIILKTTIEGINTRRINISKEIMINMAIL